MFRMLLKQLMVRAFCIAQASCALLLCLVATGHAQSIQEGQSLFATKCYSCHNVGSGDKTGPDLKAVTARRTKEWLHEFVNGPASMNAKGDAGARQLFGKFGATVMPDQGLTTQQIDSVL